LVRPAPRKRVIYLSIAPSGTYHIRPAPCSRDVRLCRCSRTNRCRSIGPPVSHCPAEIARDRGRGLGRENGGGRGTSEGSRTSRNNVSKHSKHPAKRRQRVQNIEILYLLPWSTSHGTSDIWRLGSAGARTGARISNLSGREMPARRISSRLLIDGLPPGTMAVRLLTPGRRRKLANTEASQHGVASLLQGTPPDQHATRGTQVARRYF
jgi:hypothetical protein